MVSIYSRERLSGRHGKREHTAEKVKGWRLVITLFFSHNGPVDLVGSVSSLEARFWALS